MRPSKPALAALAALTFATTAARGDECANVLVVFDRSDSMNRVVPGDERSRWEIAVPAVEEIVERYSENVRFGLMLFPGDTLEGCGAVACTPGFVAVEIGSGTSGAIADALSTTRQCTGTPIGLTMAEIPAMMALREEGKHNHVLLVTDGSETCDGNASQVAAALVRQDPPVRTFVIGFGDQVDAAELDQIAREGHTQAAFVAANAETLEEAFDQILGTVRDDPEFGCIGGEIPDGGIPGFDAGVPEGGPGADAGPPPGGDDAGCDCSAAGTGAPRGVAAAVVVAGLFAVGRRRRASRRRVRT